MFRFIYNLSLPLLALVAAPFWLLKTSKRGGLSKRLLEKLARYDADSPEETGDRTRRIYLHAVSVGEANIARKLITAWAERYPDERFLLAMGTSTGFELAHDSPPPRTEVLYAPLDFPLFIEELFHRYRPKLIVLIEHEVWPNLMHSAQRHGVPVALANARLSQRSGNRLERLRPMVGGMYSGLSWVGAQTEEDVPRLERIGIQPEVLRVAGSIKFDPSRETPSTNTFDPGPLLAQLGDGPILMALSTHSGEELIFAKAAATLPDHRIVIIPRHMERRESIVKELRDNAFQVLLRSTGETSGHEDSTKVLVVDSTGEMPSFTKLAHVAFVGKSLTATGGQNPCEAIAAEVPVITGPHLENFEPLATQLRAASGLCTISNEKELASALRRLSEDFSLRKEQIEAASNTLKRHLHATERHVEELAKLAKEN